MRKKKRGRRTKERPKEGRNGQKWVEIGDIHDTYKDKWRQRQKNNGGYNHIYGQINRNSVRHTRAKRDTDRHRETNRDVDRHIQTDRDKERRRQANINE